MEYTVQVTKRMVARSYKKIHAGSMKEAKEIIETQLNNGDYNPKEWKLQPMVYEVMPLVH